MCVCAVVVLGSGLDGRSAVTQPDCEHTIRLWIHNQRKTCGGTPDPAPLVPNQQKLWDKLCVSSQP